MARTRSEPSGSRRAPGPRLWAICWEAVDGLGASGATRGPDTPSATLHGSWPEASLAKVPATTAASAGSISRSVIAGLPSTRSRRTTHCRSCCRFPRRRPRHGPANRAGSSRSRQRAGRRCGSRLAPFVRSSHSRQRRTLSSMRRPVAGRRSNGANGSINHRMSLLAEWRLVRTCSHQRLIAREART